MRRIFFEKRNVQVILRYFSENSVFRQATVVQNGRTALGERIVNLDENTLTGRLLLYLHNESENRFKQTTGTNFLTKCENYNVTSSILKEAVHLNHAKVDQLKVTDIVDEILKLNDQNFVQSKRTIKQILNALDVTCSLHVTDLNVEEIFYILHAFMSVISNRIIDLKFYNVAIQQVLQNVQYCSKTDLLQLMFYIGLEKKSNKSRMAMSKCLKMLEKMEIVDELNVNELCIVCNSTFKTSTRIHNEILLEKVKCAINDNLLLLQDPALFITLIKTLRHNRYQDDDILNTITYTILFNKTIGYYSFGAICHILALYADYLYYDEHILKLCVEKCLEQLKEWDQYAIRRAHINENIRVKDLKRFLWAVTTLGYENIHESACRDVIVPRIKEKIDDGEFKDDMESLVECLLYLWMLNCKPIELFPNVLTPQNFDIIRAHKSRGKYRLNLLLSAIQFEDRDLFRQLNLKPSGYDYNLNLQVQHRPLLGRTYESLKLISKASSLNVFEVNFQVPFLNIVGITGYKNKVYKAVNIEILDEYTAVKNRLCYPSGLMQMKLRILRKSDVPVITICQNEIQSLNDKELKEYLQEELEFV